MGRKGSDSVSQSQKCHHDFQPHIRKQVQLSHHQSLRRLHGHPALSPGRDGSGQTGEARECQWPMKQSGLGGGAVYAGDRPGLGSHGSQWGSLLGLQHLVLFISDLLSHSSLIKDFFFCIKFSGFICGI